MNNQKKKYYVAAMTKLPFRDGVAKYDMPYKYSYKNEINDKDYIYEGYLTNEAPSYCFFDLLLKENVLFDSIVLFVTPECEDRGIVRINDTKYEDINTKEYLEMKFEKYLFNKLTDDMYKFLLERYEVDRYFNEDADKHELIKTYLRTAIKYIELTSDMNNSMLYKKIMEVVDDDYSNVEIFYDITGGPRLPQFISMLFLRAMEQQGATVKKVLYADTTGKDAPIIRNCTENYKISSILKSDNLEDLYNNLKEIGIEEKFTDEEIDRLNEISESISENTRVSSSSEIKKATEGGKIIENRRNENGNSIVANYAANENKKAMQSVNNNNPFDKLLKKCNTTKIKEIKEIIKSYNEEFFGNLIDINLITKKTKKPKDIKPSILNAIIYYSEGFETINGMVLNHSVLGEVKSMLDELKKDTRVDAEDLLKSRMSLDNAYYKKYKNIYPFRNSSVQSWDFFNKEYKKIDYVKNGLKTEELIEDVQKKITIFYNYGFPFYYPEKYVYKNEPDTQAPRDYYLKKVNDLFEEINKKREIMSSDEYINYLDEVKKNLTIRIPFKKKTIYWEFDDSEDILSCGEYKKEKYKESNIFYKEMFERIETIRPYRNAIAHNSDTYKKEEYKELLTNKIIPWLEEYKSFADDYLKIQAEKRDDSR